MDVISAKKAADERDISQRRVAMPCTEGRIEQAALVGNTHRIPTNTKKPANVQSPRYIKIDSKAVKPFLKWAGGKGQLLKEIESYYPFNDKITKYAEPFIGGGAVLFDILSRYDLSEVYISYINAELINPTV